MQRALLCLKCRLPGHVVKDCFRKDWQPELDWTFSSARRYLNVGESSQPDRSVLCERCIGLDLPKLLNEHLDWTSSSTLNQVANEGHDHIRVIGKTGSIEYWSDCQLCRCLFALTPNPWSNEQDIVMFPYWTISRLEGSVVIDNDVKRQYSKCLMVTLQPSSEETRNLPFENRASRGDALCFQREDHTESQTVLSGRQLSDDGVDTQMVLGWLAACQHRHPLTCMPQWTDALRGIRLLDVSDTCRPQVVPYPDEPCEYIALSYVWGSIEKRSFTIGPIETVSLPQTFIDAIEFVRRLGKRYLWVDLVCIDQLDETDKRIQIERMGDIYRGAFATIVAMSGPSAATGLPRMGRHQSTFSQLRCRIGERELLGTMPSLSQMIWISPWGLRSWTLPEAWLSRRCIYFSDFQVYFECNAMQCCESLDETDSPIHQLIRTAQTDMSGPNVGGGCLRHTLFVDGVPSEPLLTTYASALVLYSYRSMSESRDAINAFSGMLQDWNKDYGNDFHFGLPVQFFQWGLLWTAQSRLERRPEFPTWSWAGWKGALWQRLPIDRSVPDPYPSYLSVYKMMDHDLELLFESKPNSLPDEQAAHFGNDPIANIGGTSVFNAKFDLPDCNDAAIRGYLVVEGVLLRLIPLLGGSANSEQAPRARPSENLTTMPIYLKGVGCLIRYNSSDIELTARNQTENDFLLVAREWAAGWIHHWLLLLEFEGDIANRVTTLCLLVPEIYAKVLEEASPRQAKFILA